MPMESVASSSSPPDHHQPPRQFEPSEALTERVLRALDHRLRLLHRSTSDFFVLGATGNVYTVFLSDTPSCSCPDRITPCKHILFVYIRVLGISLDDTCLWKRTLRPCQLSRLVAIPTLTETLAGTSLRERFHQLFFQARPGSKQPSIEIEDGTMCPVCLEEMASAEKLVACGTCRNPIHEECLLAWKRSSRRRSATCVICRARWKNTTDQDRYLNLSAYISEDDMAEDDEHCDQ